METLFTIAWNTQSPTHGVPIETYSSEESFSTIQRVAILAYKGGVFWGKVNSPDDLKEQNDPLLEVILQVLSRELSSGAPDQIVDHMEKIARMRSALLDVFDFFERSHGVLPSWSEVVKALRLSEAHSYSMEEQARLTRDYIYQRMVKIG